MNLVDVHCHLQHENYKGKLDELIQRSKEAGVKAIICSGVNRPTNEQALELSKKYDIVNCTMGLYPIELLGLGPDAPGLRSQKNMELDTEFEYIKKNKDSIVGIGEVGMDYYWDKEQHSTQREHFSKIIEFVEKLKKPIVIHSRKAEQECIDMLESSSIKKVLMHCFSAKKGQMKRVRDNGWYASIPPIVVKLQHFETLIDIMPINQLLTETDAPWLSPDREKMNEPAYVIESIKKIATIKGLDEQETANMIFKNYMDLFG